MKTKRINASISKEFQDVLHNYMEQTGTKSEAAALLALAAIGYTKWSGNDAPAPNHGWGGIRSQNTEVKK